ncbi:hypothetical protein OKW46_002469 [Paraburkholderia sp. WSM4179]|nr:hypothetical protein [Paraburkholderia sp. WSM4179]
MRFISSRRPYAIYPKFAADGSPDQTAGQMKAMAVSDVNATFECPRESTCRWVVMAAPGRMATHSHKHHELSSGDK